VSWDLVFQGLSDAERFACLRGTDNKNNIPSSNGRERKIARHIIEFGIRNFHNDVPEKLDVEAWQNEIASKPFNLKQASEYLGISTVTLRRWIKAGRISAYKVGRVYSLDVFTLKNFKKKNIS
jgi:excisionase family DNA binding protein